jgi:hypothetical protein
VLILLICGTFEPFPESLIVCDRQEQIVWINAAARRFFEVASQALCQETGYQQFLQRYARDDAQQRPLSSEQWLMNLVCAEETGCGSPENTLLLQMPSGRKVSVNVHSFLVSDPQHNAGETVHVFQETTHHSQKALHLQRVHEAVLTLTEAIVQLPEQMDLSWPEETLLLSPPVLFVAQQLVDVIRHVLDCRRVNVLALGPPAGHLYFVAGSGFTAEQEQLWREMGGRFLPSEMVDETVLARFHANQEVLLASHHLPKRELLPGVRGPETFLLIPLFVEQQWAGVLTIVKANSDRGFTSEEIALVKIVAAQTVLVMECLRCFQSQAEARTRARVLHEVTHLTDEFLILASHELRTPLTGIMGNLQLAQRRLETLKRQLATQPNHVHEQIAQAQQPLTCASQSAHLQQRMINDLIDDARVRTNQLALSMAPCDLLALTKEVVVEQQRSVPERTIVLETLPAEPAVPLIADARR